MNELYNNYLELINKIHKYLLENQFKDPPYFFISDQIPKIYIPDFDLLKKKIQQENNLENSKTKIETRQESYFSDKNIKIQQENLICNLCKDKVYAVKNYFKLPKSEPYPLLVLLYNGSYNVKKLPRDNSDKFYFSSEEEDNLFDRMLQAVNLNITNLYFQEFVACHFSPNSTIEEWEVRVKNCLSFLEKNLEKYNIEKILLVGNAALLLFGQEAIKMANKSEVLSLNFNNKEYPTMIIRSPIALLTIEQKRKEFQTHLQKYTEEYQLFLKNKNQMDEIIQKILKEIPKEDKNIKLINNVKLIVASQIESDKQIEEKIKKQLGMGKYLLYMAVKYRKEEIAIKQQILNSLQQLLK
jgi:uracil-DNA glycosylase family 4